MKSIVSLAAVAALACASAFANGPERATRYRVEEVRPPASLLAPCLAGYRNFAVASINDFGVAGGTFNCYSQIDLQAGIATLSGGPFAWASWFGALELQDSDPASCCSFATSIDNRGEVFGSDVGPVFVGVKWSLAGGLETVFPNDPQCEFIKLDIAIAGNGRYTVGTGFRPGPELPFPGFCFTPTWLTRTPSGTVVAELPNVEPRDLNAFNTAAGVKDRNTAIRFQVVTKELRILRTGDETHQAITTDINDLGEISGYLATIDPLGVPFGCFTLSARALRWDRNGREIELPPLPGATSARASGVGIDGETVGDSGPGHYCDPQISTDERAVLWRGGKVFDLNEAIPAHLRVTLTSAGPINRRGQILAIGYREDEPLVICPKSDFDPATGQSTTDFTRRCPNQHAFVLTPAGH